LPTPPAVLDWTAQVATWPMMRNDTIGDCTCAAAGHMIECWTTNVGDPFTPADADVVAMYSAVSGYVPGNPATDVGATCEDALNYWMNTGLAGHKIAGFMSFDPKVRTDHEDSVDLFGGVYLGVQMPLSAQAQTGPGLVWDVPPGGATGDGEPGSWGGHAVPIVAYDSTGVTVVTWGALQKATWAFVSTYADEAYAVLAADWVDASTQLSPDNFAYSALQAYLKQI
jgi:hypothetical protein